MYSSPYLEIDRCVDMCRYYRCVDISTDCPILGVVPLVRLGVARPPVHRAHHDVGPGLARGAAEQHDLGLENISKVVVSVDLGLRVEGDVSKHLHPDYGVDEEQHQH